MYIQCLDEKNTCINKLGAKKWQWPFIGRDVNSKPYSVLLDIVDLALCLNNSKHSSIWLFLFFGYTEHSMLARYAFLKKYHAWLIIQYIMLSWLWLRVMRKFTENQWVLQLIASFLFIYLWGSLNSYLHNDNGNLHLYSKAGLHNFITWNSIGWRLLCFNFQGR